MKHKKSVSTWPHGLDSELKDLPEKVVKVDEDIEVLVRDFSSKSWDNNTASWDSSLEKIRQTDPEWLNSSSLVLAGSPKKNQENGVSRNKKKENRKNNLNPKTSMSKMGVNSPRKKDHKPSANFPMAYLNNNGVSSIGETLMEKSTDLRTDCVVHLNSNNGGIVTPVMVKEDPNGSSLTQKLRSNLFLKAIQPSYSDLESSTLASLLLNCDNKNSSTCINTDLNSPQYTYFMSTKIKQEKITDFFEPKNDADFLFNGNGHAHNHAGLPETTSHKDKLHDSDAESHSRNSSSPSCSTSVSISMDSINSDVFNENDKIENAKTFNYRSSKREMQQLYVSLKEIPWAQNWDPDSVLEEKKFPRQRRAQRLKLKTPTKPSNITKKNKAVKALVGKSVKVTSTEGKSFPVEKIISLKKRKKMTELGNRSVSKPLKKKIIDEESQIRYKLNLNYKNCKPKGLNLEPKQTKVAVKSIPKKKVDNKKGFAIRFDFLNSKQNGKDVEAPVVQKKKSGPVKTVMEKNHTVKTVFDKNTTFKLSDTSSTMFPELKVKLKPVDGIDKRRIEDSTRLCLMDNILQRHITLALQGKEDDNDIDYENMKLRKRKLDDDTVRYSVRQTEGAFRYKEIAVKKHPGFIQIILVPNSNKQNGLAIEALIELKDAIIAAKKDPSCKLVLINSSGSVFCCGVDLGPLVGADKIKVAERTANAIRDLVKVLALFSKPLVAAVNGATIGFGVAMLALCDVVFASDKATFHTPYTKLGHIPEAAITLTLPQAVGTIVSSDMLLRGRILTAQEAKVHGLVSEVIWPTMLMEEVIPRVKSMVKQPLQAMELTKMMLRSNQLERLKFTLENETRLLPKQWLSPYCQNAICEVVKRGGHLYD